MFSKSIVESMRLLKLENIDENIGNIISDYKNQMEVASLQQAIDDICENIDEVTNYTFNQYRKFTRFNYEKEKYNYVHFKEELKKDSKEMVYFIKDTIIKQELKNQAFMIKINIKIFLQQNYRNNPKYGRLHKYTKLYYYLDHM
jgi:hypothetical protein